MSYHQMMAMLSSRVLSTPLYPQLFAMTWFSTHPIMGQSFPATISQISRKLFQVISTTFYPLLFAMTWFSTHPIMGQSFPATISQISHKSFRVFLTLLFPLLCTMTWFSGLGIRSFQKNVTFLRSFPFFIKECGVLCVLFRSL